MLHFIDRRGENRVISSGKPPVRRHPIHPTFVSRNVARDKNVAELSDKWESVKILLECLTGHCMSGWVEIIWEIIWKREVKDVLGRFKMSHGLKC